MVRKLGRVSRGGGEENETYRKGGVVRGLVKKQERERESLKMAQKEVTLPKALSL
jgi:hypothetical protein